MLRYVGLVFMTTQQRCTYFGPDGEVPLPRAPDILTCIDPKP